MKLRSCRPSHLFGQSIEYSNLLYVYKNLQLYHKDVNLNQWSAGRAKVIFRIAMV